jgi:hypothetical protein
MPLILGANTLSAGGYEVDNSLRFNSGSSDYLSRTQGTGNRKTWTYSVWLKRSILGTNQNWGITQEDAANNNAMPCSFNTFDKIDWYDYNAPSVSGQLSTNRVFRDTSAWYHIVLAVDTTNATADDRMKMYVNGVQETSFATRVNPSLNYDFNINVNTKLCAIGAYYTSSPATFYDGYMSEINFIDGQQLAPSDFGEFDEDSGIWKPIAYEGTYGTNGFYLEFKDSSALGDDTSGTGNDFTVNNLTSIDQTTDTPTNNFATMNPLTKSSLANLEEGNLKVIANSPADNGNTQITFAPQVGKWYFECKLTIDNASYPRIGIAPIESVGRLLNANDGQAGVITGSAAQYANGDKYISGSQTASYGASYSTGDIMGIALDFDNGAFYTSKNGTWQGSSDPESGASKTNALFTWTAGAEEYIASLTTFNTSSAIEVNFGNPAFTISSGNSDANGYGNFEYAVPSGYYALCTKI